MAGIVNSANTLYLLVESVKADTKHRSSSISFRFLLTTREVRACVDCRRSRIWLLDCSDLSTAVRDLGVKTGALNDDKTGEIAALLNWR
jgi:hypothetical protein